MIKHKLKGIYFICFYLGLFILSIGLYYYINLILQDLTYYVLYIFIITLFVLSIFQYKAYIGLSDEVIVRYVGFGKIGKAEIKICDIQSVELKRVFTKLIINGKHGQVMEFSNYINDFKNIGMKIYNISKKADLNVLFNDNFIKYFVSKK